MEAKSQIDAAVEKAEAGKVLTDADYLALAVKYGGVVWTDPPPPLKSYFMQDGVTIFLDASYSPEKVNATYQKSLPDIRAAE